MSAINIPKVEEINVLSLKEDNKNPNIMSKKAFESLKKVIKKYGFIVPIITNKDLVIADGHHRWKAAQELKLDFVPVIKLDVSEVDRRLLRQIMNKLKGQHDQDLDLEEFKFLFEADIKDDLLDLLPDQSNEINKLLRKIEEGNIEQEEEFVEVTSYERAKNKTKIQQGDIFQLGNHRLMCGDSTKESDVNKLMDGKKAEMCFTDPPYGMNFKGSVHKDGSKSFNSNYNKIKNDDLNIVDELEFIKSFCNNIIENTKGAFYVFYYRLGFHKVINELNKYYKNTIIWEKNNHTLSNSDYMSKYEPIVYGWINQHNFQGSKSEFDIWQINRTQKNDLHPTMKPIDLCIKAIMNSSKQNNLVLDLFGGSGSTLIASEQLNRICYMMELDPVYCEVICERWEKYTGKNREKVN